MIKQNYILLIINCEKYRYKAYQQKAGWLASLPENIIYYHVIGNPLLDTEYVFDDSNRILYVKTQDDYISLPKKVIHAYLAIDSEYEYKYIFKTDDDQNLINPLFFYELMNNIENEKPNYGGKYLELETPQISNYHTVHPELPENISLNPTIYCNGRFYILSKIAVIDLIKKMNEIKEEYFEDYAIGYYMDDELKKSFLHINNDVFIDFE